MVTRKSRRRIGMAFWGVIITGFCVGGLQKANFGTDPFTCFVTGIAQLFGTSYSVFYVVVTGIFLGGVFVTQRHYIGGATVINLLLTGPAAGVAHSFLNMLMPHPGVSARLMVMGGALVVMCFSSALYFTADIGVSAYDAWALMAANDYHLTPFRVARVVSDSTCVLIGFLCGVMPGIGTIITALCMGPLTSFFRSRVTEPFLAAVAD